MLDEHDPYKFYHSTITVIAWSSICSLYYSILISYGPDILGIYLSSVGVKKLEALAIVFVLPFAVPFLAWPLFMTMRILYTYFHGIFVHYGRKELPDGLPETAVVLYYFGIILGSFSFVTTIAAATFYQSWVALGKHDVSLEAFIFRISQYIA